MNPILRVLLGILGIFVTIVAVAVLLFSGTCLGDGLGMLGAPSPGLAWGAVLIAAGATLVSLFALWLGVRLSRWGLRGPALHEDADSR